METSTRSPRRKGYLTAEEFMARLDRIERQQNQRPVKRQFSKVHVVFANFLVLLVYIGSFILAWFEKPGGTEIMQLALAIVAAYGVFATCGYFTQNIMRAQSINKLKAKHVESGVRPEEAHYGWD